MKKYFLLFILGYSSIILSAQDTVRIFVALWDSPPKTDLYWGKLYGIKTYFKKDADWVLISECKPGKTIEEELLFYNDGLDLYVNAKAYNTLKIRDAIEDFIGFAYQAKKDDLAIYVGHDGLMDFNIDVIPQKNICPAMVFSCVSQQYFSPYLDMILSTYTYMAPEAYGVMAAIESWAKKDSEEDIRKNTAVAYAKYQKITIGSAEHTFIEYDLR